MSNSVRMQDIWNGNDHDARSVATRALEIIRRLEYERDAEFIRADVMSRFRERDKRAADDIFALAAEQCGLAEAERRMAEVALRIIFACLADAEDDLEASRVECEAVAAELVAARNERDDLQRRVGVLHDQLECATEEAIFAEVARLAMKCAALDQHRARVRRQRDDAWLGQ